MSVEDQGQAVPSSVPPGGPVADSHRRRGLLFLALAVGCVGFAFALQIGMNANFVGEEMRLTGSQQGNLEAVRESCGIVALGVLALLAGLAEPVVAAMMLLLVGVGLGAYCFVPSYGWLIAASLVWSGGLHVWMPLPNAMALALAERGRAGWRLGQVRAAGMVGAGAGLLAGLALSWAGLAIRPLFLVAGAAAVVAAGACLGIPRRIRTPGARLVFRRRYALYYLLCFLEGWRKQIFVAFAGFLLVRHYGVGLEVMLGLSIAHHAIGWLASPWVGRLIDRFGERPVLVFYFAALTCFFTGYALIDDVRVLGGLYVVDSAFFVFAMALTTYVSRIAPPAEHTPTLGMGVACNHVAAVLMPLLGAVLWRTVGYEWVFLAGAAGAAVSVVVSLRVPARAEGGAPHVPAG